MAGRRTGLLASGVPPPRLPGESLSSPVAGARAPRLPWPGHSGGTAPVSHRTSLDHRPYLRAESTAQLSSSAVGRPAGRDLRSRPQQISGPRRGRKMRQGMRLPSPALVLAGLALFVALGGTVYAAKRKTRINGRAVKVKSLPGNRVKVHSIPANRLKPGVLKSVTGAGPGPIVGAEIDELTLDQVPEAAHAWKPTRRRAPTTPRPPSTRSTPSTRRRSTATRPAACRKPCSSPAPAGRARRAKRRSAPRRRRTPARCRAERCPRRCSWRPSLRCRG